MTDDNRFGDRPYDDLIVDGDLVTPVSIDSVLDELAADDTLPRPDDAGDLSTPGG